MNIREVRYSCHDDYLERVDMILLQQNIENIKDFLEVQLIMVVLYLLVDGFKLGPQSFQTGGSALEALAGGGVGIGGDLLDGLNLFQGALDSLKYEYNMKFK